MNAKHALLAWASLTSVYLAALVWADSRNQWFHALPQVASALPLLMGISLLSYAVRYLRWRWLLNRCHHRLQLVTGFLAYLSGFAFTASPGKAGELVRIRYHVPEGVPPQRVLSAFLFERSFDLIAVLLLASLALNRADLLVFAAGFVTVFLTVVASLALHPNWFNPLSKYLHYRRLEKAARFVDVLKEGFAGCRVWLTPWDAAVALVLGMVAWGLTSLSFVLLLKHLDITATWQVAVSIYPLAMLIGAASMLPGGIGSTELAIVALLRPLGTSFETALLAAVGIRFATLWFAIACGLFSIALLESRYRRMAESPVRTEEKI